MRKILTLAFGVAAIAVTAAQSIAETIDERRADELIYLVKQDCGSCHGMTMKGGLGPSLLPENLIERDEESISDTILYGVPGTPMPPWESLLSTEEAVWIARQLKDGLDP